MTCPDCNGDNTRVTDTYHRIDYTRRNLACRDCGVRWETRELLDLNSIVRPKLPIRPPPNGGLPPVNHPLTTFKPPVKTRQMAIGGTVGGSDSPVLDLVPVPFGVLEAKSSEVVSKRRTGRGDALEYPAEFEELWAGCTNRRGNKHPAFKSWLNLRPPLTLTIERYLLWSTTDGWRRGFVPHLSTWLNRRGWEDVPTAAEVAGPTQAQASNGGPPRKSWIEEQNDRAIAESMAESRRKASQ
jgi:hypothetical protein